MSKLDGNQTLQGAYRDDDQAFAVKQLAQLVPEAYDYISLTYISSGNGAGEIETVTYKMGGSGGTSVATLTLTYDASNRIETITRS